MSAGGGAPPAAPAALARALEAWYARDGRDLPWRTRRADPYAVWLSEAMLQQTRVESVVGRYEDMLRRFPDVAALAASDEGTLLAAWEGLGYYRRARQLHRAAGRVVAEHGGRLPDDPDALARLPGFGPYMTAAVASIAFGRRLPATDANAVRVIARLARLEPPAGSGALLTRARALHAAIVQAADDPGALNQALMDVGARICGRRPRCGLCPLRAGCAAFAAGGPALAALYPRRRPGRVRPERRVALAVIVAEDRVLAAERPPGLLGGLWGLPSAELADAPDDAPDDAPNALRTRLGRALVEAWGAPAALAATGLADAGAFDWAFTHRLWRIRLYTAAAAAAWPPSQGAWLDPEARARVAFGGPFRAALARAAAAGGGGRAAVSRRSASRAGPG